MLLIVDELTFFVDWKVGTPEMGLNLSWKKQDGHSNTHGELTRPGYNVYYHELLIGLPVASDVVVKK